MLPEKMECCLPNAVYQCCDHVLICKNEEIPMKSDRNWKLLAAAFIVALFYIGSSLNQLLGGEPLTQQAFGQAGLIGPAMTIDAEDTLITSSADGRTLYVWTFGRRTLNEQRLPEFQRSIHVYSKK